MPNKKLFEILTKNMNLTNREAEVAVLVSTGLSNKEIANSLFVTEKTIKFHLQNIYKKMNVKSRAQLIVWCLPHMEFFEPTKEEEVEEVNVTYDDLMAMVDQELTSQDLIAALERKTGKLITLTEEEG